MAARLRLLVPRRSELSGDFLPELFVNGRRKVNLYVNSDGDLLSEDNDEKKRIL